MHTSKLMTDGIQKTDIHYAYSLKVLKVLKLKKDGEPRNEKWRAAVPRTRQRSAAPVVGHHGHSTAPSR